VCHQVAASLLHVLLVFFVVLPGCDAARSHDDALSGFARSSAGELVRVGLQAEVRIELAHYREYQPESSERWPPNAVGRPSDPADVGVATERLTPEVLAHPSNLGEMLVRVIYHADPHVLLSGLAFGESPRWHDDRLWFSDWGAEQLIAVDLEGNSEVVAQVQSFPFCIDWLPDGRLLIVHSRDRLLLRQEPDGSLVPHADLSGLSHGSWNEIVVDGRGNAYVNGAGFDLMAGEDFSPGLVALVTRDGTARQVAEGIAFPNGMAVTPDNSTLIVAESYASRLTAFDILGDGSLSNRRVWAELDNDPPDGLCLDAEGAAWYATVPNNRCVRVREGGAVLQTIDLDRGCFACMLGGPDGRTLFLVAREWHGMDISQGSGTGQILTAQAPAPGAGWP
jgi:sugar lactone lactonase YvrE